MRKLFLVLTSLCLAACASGPQSAPGKPKMVDAPPSSDSEKCPLGQQMVCRATSRTNIQTGDGRFCRCEITQSIH